MIYVIATVELVDGKRGRYLEELNKIIPKVRAETGCLEYGPATDVMTEIPVQEPVHENVITIMERWTDLQALNVHLKTPHMKTYRDAVKTLVKGLKIRVLQPLECR
jgi:quinol monooxygenase YgiN